VDLAALPSTFYRVSVKALVFDDQQRLLVFQDSRGKWELPGGGLEHGEDLRAGLARELFEEMQVSPSQIGPVEFVYSCLSDKGFYKLSIAMVAELESHDFVPSADDLVAAKFVTKAEFIALSFQSSEVGILPYADQIWAEH
jgi:ADP-ribose pyrophosphatase YjhB (NUDIX family)